MLVSGLVYIFIFHQFLSGKITAVHHQTNIGIFWFCFWCFQDFGSTLLAGIEFYSPLRATKSSSLQFLSEISFNVSSSKAQFLYTSDLQSYSLTVVPSWFYF